MDLPSENLILSLKILPSNQHCKPPLQMYFENKTVTKGYCAVGGIKCVGKMRRSTICYESSLTDLPKEASLSPLKRKPRNGVVEPPLQHPAAQRYN